MMMKYKNNGKITSKYIGMDFNDLKNNTLINGEKYRQNLLLNGVITIIHNYIDFVKINYGHFEYKNEMFKINMIVNQYAYDYLNDTFYIFVIDDYDCDIIGCIVYKNMYSYEIINFNELYKISGLIDILHDDFINE